jgi:hypothetical protein
MIASRRRRCAVVTPNSPHSASVRLAVGVSLPAEGATISTVSALVCRELRVTVRADQSQVLPAVVRRVPVDMVQHQRQGQAKPRIGPTADGATVRLSVGEVLADVVTAAAVDPRLTGLEPTLRTRLAPGRLLTCIAAVNLLASLGKCGSATATLPHMPTLKATTDKLRRAGASYRD